MSNPKSLDARLANEARRQPERFLEQPRELVDRARLQVDRRRGEGAGFGIETFTLPLEAARRKVRDIIGSTPQHGHLGIVERWRQLPDGWIEFSMRRLPASD